MLIHFIGKKWYKNILVYNISYKSLITAKPLSIRFNKVDGSIRVSDGTRYLALFGPEKCDATYNRIRYVKKRYQKSSIHMVFFFQLFKNQNWFMWFFTSRKNIGFTCSNAN